MRDLPTHLYGRGVYPRLGIGIKNIRLSVRLMMVMAFSEEWRRAYFALTLWVPRECKVWRIKKKLADNLLSMTMMKWKHFLFCRSVPLSIFYYKSGRLKRNLLLMLNSSEVRQLICEQSKVKMLQMNLIWIASYFRKATRDSLTSD